MRYMAGPDNEISDEIWGMDEDEHIDYLDRQDEHIEDDAERAVRNTISSPYMADYIVSLIKNGPGHSAKNTPGTVRVSSDPLQEDQVTTKNPTAHLSAIELNRMIHHPIWCARDCCVEWEGMGDVWHESRVQTTKFDTDPVRINQEFTASSKMVRYSVVNEEDSPAGAEITLTSEEMDERISLFLGPNTLRDLAKWLTDRAEEIDVACGKDGLA